jgi:hypothetical protein
MKTLFQTLVFSIFLASGLQAQDTNWVKQNTWFFDNFIRSESTISWDLYREGFIGLPPTYGEAFIFDQVIFDQVYKKLFPIGHCMGIDLMGLQLIRYGGYDGYCAPAYQYPGDNTASGAADTIGPVDQNLVHSIQLMHGRQLGHRFLSNILDIIAESKNRDGNFAYGQYKYFEAKKEPCLISITKGFNPADGGHVLVPYFGLDSLGIKKKLYVYDPNASWYNAAGHDYYTSGQNFVEINVADGHWIYRNAPDTVPWQGKPSGGLSDNGNLMIFPFSIVRSKDRLPQSLFADAAEAIGKIFIYGDARLDGIATPDGRTFDPIGVGEGRIPSLRAVMPFIPMNGGGPSGIDGTLWFIRGENDFTLDICGGAKGYKVQVFSDNTAFTIASDEPYAEESVVVKNLHLEQPEVEMRKTNGESRAMISATCRSDVDK